MEAREIIGRQLTETDFAIRSLAGGDDLDGKVSRASLDLQHLRAEVASWHERLNRVRHIMQSYKSRAQAEVHTMLKEILEGSYPDDEMVSAVLTSTGGLGMANEVLAGVSAAGALLAAHLERQEKALVEPPNLKGRIRVMRQELARFESIAKAAEQFLSQNPHPAYEDEQRARLDISHYGRRRRDLAQMESLLVNPASYVPHSESAHLRHLVIEALTAGGK